MLPYPIAPSQTDAKSPIDQQLMDSIRLDLDYLETQIGGAGSGGATHFRVNGPLYPIRGMLSVGAGKKMDGAIVVTPTTFTRCRLSLLKGGTSGNLEVDVLRHISVNHPIAKIEPQYTAATQSIGRLGSAINTQSIGVATANISTQQITKIKPSLNIRSIVNIGGNNWLYTFTGTTLLDSDYQIGDYMLFAGATSGANNGEFQITQVNYDGLPSVVISNASGVEQLTATGTGILSMYSYEYASAVNANFAAGEEVIFSGHSFAGNNGTKTIFATNYGANNIVCKFSGGQEQLAVAGTAACTRWTYSYASAVDNTYYIVGEKALFASHTTGANNGSFIIRAVNDGGNNIIVTNPAGVTQAGAAGNANTLRWLYAMPTDPSADISVGDYVTLDSHTTGANNGYFEVKVVNRLAANNIEIYNEAGVAQAGVAGTVTTEKKLIWFDTNFSASYEADESKVLLEGLKSQTDNIALEFPVVEVNRGGFSNYNIVVKAASLSTQGAPAGRVAVEARSIFSTRPKIEIAQAGQVRNYQFTSNAVIIDQVIPEDSLLSMDILELPLGFPDTLLLSLS